MAGWRPGVSMCAATLVLALALAHLRGADAAACEEGQYTEADGACANITACAAAGALLALARNLISTCSRSLSRPHRG